MMFLFVFTRKHVYKLVRRMLKFKFAKETSPCIVHYVYSTYMYAHVCVHVWYT